MKTATKTAFATVLIASATLVGFSCKPKAPAAGGQHCYLVVFPDGAPLGAKVLHDGAKVGGAVEKGPRWEDKYVAGSNDPREQVPFERPMSLVCVPGSTWLSDGGALALERKTPCGDRSVRLEPSEPLTRDWEERALAQSQREGRYMPVFHVELADTEALPTTNVWYIAPQFPLAADVTVTIGQASFTLPRHYDPTGRSPAPTTVFDLGCQASHSVKVDGRDVGTIEIGADGPPKGLVINERGGCLRFANVLYRYADSPYQDVPGDDPGWARQLQGSILPLRKVDRIDHFLEAAPDAKTAQRHNLFSVIELVETPCAAAVAAPPVPDAPPKKKGAPSRPGR